ncbi:MAG: Ig-like domain-containing protein [Anaerolineales bacterium]
MACSLPGRGSTPTVTISAPPNGAQVAAGQTVEVVYHAEDAQEVARVDMTASGQMVASQTPPVPGQKTADGILRWTPDVPGTYTLLLTAYNSAGKASAPAGVSVAVVEAVADAPTPTSVPTFTATPAGGSPGGQGQPTATPRVPGTVAGPTPTATTRSGSSGAGSAGGSGNSGSSGAATPTATKPSSSGSSGGGSQATRTPTPTTQAAQQPTKTPTPTQSSGGVVGNPPQAVTIQSVSAAPDPVYYGLCTGGEPTYLTVLATIDDPAGMAQDVRVSYDYGEGNMIVAVYNYSAPMAPQQGIGDYSAGIDVGTDAFGLLSGDGWLEFVVDVTDTSGNVTSSSVQFVDVKVCQSQLYLVPVINSFTGPSGSLNPGDSYTLQWDVSDADCGVFLDGSQVNASGSQQFTAPGDNVYQAWTHTLVAKGGPCDNPSEVSADVQIVVEPPTTTVAKGSGTVMNNFSLDVGDGNGDDVIFSHTSSDVQLLGAWGATMDIWPGGQPSVSDCKGLIDAGSFSSVSVSANDYVCYKTGSGNYGYLVINGMSLDSNDPSNSYVDLSYETEITP